MPKGNKDGWKNAPNSTTPSTNSASIAMNRELLRWPVIDLSDPEALMQRFDDYMDLCERHGSKPLVSGWCAALDVSRSELVGWSKGAQGRLAKGLSPESSRLLKKILETFEVSWEFAMQNNGYRHPVSGIFLGKNNFGYKDVSETIVSHESAAQGPSRAQLEDKYLAALPQDAPAVVISVEKVDDDRESKNIDVESKPSQK